MSKSRNDRNRQFKDMDSTQKGRSRDQRTQQKRQLQQFVRAVDRQKGM